MPESNQHSSDFASMREIIDAMAWEKGGDRRIRVNRYCRRHSSHFCPCVRPSMYRKGDKRSDPTLWDRAVEERQAKATAKREEARLEYEERMVANGV